MEKQKQNLSIKVYSRLTKEQADILDKQCKHYNLDRSQFIRDLILRHELKSKTDKESLSELRKIGVNINQIARTLNSERKINNIDFLIVKFDLLISHLKDILSKIKGV